MRKILVATAALALAAGGSIAYAAIPDSDDGEYHACSKNALGGNGHEVRFIDKQASESCSSGWTEKTWKSGGAEHGTYTGTNTGSGSGSASVQEVRCDSASEQADVLLSASGRTDAGASSTVLALKDYLYSNPNSPDGTVGATFYVPANTSYSITAVCLDTNDNRS